MNTRILINQASLALLEIDNQKISQLSYFYGLLDSNSDKTKIEDILIYLIFFSIFLARQIFYIPLE